MVRCSLLITATTIAVFPFRACAATCYHIDGSQTDDSYQPCNPDAETSACCATNKANPDVCLSSGLCYAQEPYYNGLIYSNGCTDPTGEADECPHFCPDRTNNWDGGSEVAIYNILQCNSGRQYCCRSSDDSRNCCSNSTATTTFDIGSLQLATKTATVSVSGTGVVTISSTPTSASSETCSAASTSPAECPKDNTAVVGGAVGGGLGAALLASLSVIAVLWRRRKQGPEGSPGVPAATYTGKYTGYPEQPARPVQELQAMPPRSELEGNSYQR